MISDARLVRRATAGDERAFSAIFSRYHQRLYRYCIAILGDPTDAQDALQNTMVKVLRSLPGEERQIELKPWLYRIAHNEAIELLRRRHPTEELDPEALAGPALTDRVEARERLRRLIGDLGELGERQRGALVMRELSGLSFKEIASALDTSPAVARQTVYEARLSLRQMEEGREMRCEEVIRALSDADGRVTRRRDIRAHLRHCPDCQRFREEIAGRERDLSALAPLPAVAAAGLLHGVLGSQAGGGSIAGALGGGAAKSLGASAALKATATVAVVAAIGTGAADRGGLVNLGWPGGAGSNPTRIEESGGPAATPTPSPSADDAAASDPGHLTRAARARARVGQADRPLGHSVGGGATPNSLSAPASHANGRGHEKSAGHNSAHGKSTAAAHKAAPHGKSAAHSHPSPSKPAHPTHPSKPSPPPQATEGPPGPPPQAAGEGAVPDSAGGHGDRPK